MNNQLINQLNQIVEHKLEFFTEIYSITMEQKKDIEDNDADNIAALVQQKQDIIDRVNKLDEDFLSGYKKLKEELHLDSLDFNDTKKYPEMESIKTHIEKIMGMAHKIMELENSNREKLNAIFQEVKNELRQINTGKRSLKAYEPQPVYNDGIYIDKKK